MKLKVFDNLVSSSHQIQIYEYCMNLDWVEDNDYPMYYVFSQEELEKIGLFKYILDCMDNTSWFTRKKFYRSCLNISKSNTQHFIHTHFEDAILYYANPDWNDEQCGQTFFYDNQKNIEFTSSYTPGRILLFDGSIPHDIKPPPDTGPKYRLTINTFFR